MPLKQSAENKSILLSLKRFGTFLKNNKKREYLLYAGIILAVLILYVSALQPDKKIKAFDDATNAAASSDADNTYLKTEEKLSNVLSSIRGAGKVDVMITYETGPEMVPAMSMDTNSNSMQTRLETGQENSTLQQTESSKPATISGKDGTEPIILTQKQPAVRGVIVVAEGAADVIVRMDLLRAVQTVLNVPASAIEVFEMSSQNEQNQHNEPKN